MNSFGKNILVALFITIVFYSVMTVAHEMTHQTIIESFDGCTASIDYFNPRHFGGLTTCHCVNITVADSNQIDFENHLVEIVGYPLQIISTIIVFLLSMIYLELVSMRRR